MELIGVGRITLWEGGSLWIGEARAGTDAHAHHAWQVSVALRGALRLRTPKAQWRAYSAAIVPPHAPHAFEAKGSIVANVFCEPESATGRKLLGRFGAGAIAPIDADEIAGSIAPLHQEYTRGAADEALNARARDVLGALAGDARTYRPADPRIVKAIEAVSRCLDGPIVLADIAAVAHLSPSRFRHLFVAETGMPLRRYVLWQRLQRALQAAVAGASWAEAAHAVCFADAAHLARTFRRMFGVAPSALGERRGGEVGGGRGRAPLLSGR